MVAESSPAERKAPTGTSATRWMLQRIEQGVAQFRLGPF